MSERIRTTLTRIGAGVAALFVGCVLSLLPARAVAWVNQQFGEPAEVSTNE